MTQGLSILKGDTLQKASSAGFILGALLITGSGLMMPRANTPTSDLQQMLKPLGEHEFLTQLSSLLIAIGFGRLCQARWDSTVPSKRAAPPGHRWASVLF